MPLPVDHGVVIHARSWVLHALPPLCHATNAPVISTGVDIIVLYRNPKFVSEACCDRGRYGNIFFAVPFLTDVAPQLTREVLPHKTILRFVANVNHRSINQINTPGLYFKVGFGRGGYG